MSIYIHIPFCHSKCAYCDFYSKPHAAGYGHFIDALIAEYTLRRGEVAGPVNTIYLGGGTPSLLPVDELSRLVHALPVEGIAEFTIEANPEDVTPEKVRAWRELGINRVSMGVQSLVDSELALIGRRHSAAEAIEAVNVLRSGGIDNISLDLIYGLPTQTLDSWAASLHGILDLRPQHLSAYMLSYEPRTRLNAMLKAGKITAVDEDVVVQMYNLLTHEARARGYEHYEISNFALPGFKAKHNSGYWDGTPYLGLGPAAHSFDGKTRRINPPDIKQYISKLSLGVTDYEIDEETRSDRFNDMVITRLRTADGLDFAKVPVVRRLRLLRDAYPYIEQGKILVIDNHLRIPESHWLISDAILRDLLQSG